jgi:hypothetical protein
MSIQSTLDISRTDAISRIRKIQLLLSTFDFLALEADSSEHDIKIDAWLPLHQPTRDEILHLEQFTNNMIEEIIDQPFYRFSMFDNYCVS